MTLHKTMMKKLLLSLGLAGLAGWTCAQETKPEAKADAPIEVAAGKEFSISLKSNPTTGYRWQLAKPADETMLKLVKSGYQADPHPAGMVGVGGKEVWTFNAVNPGKTTLEFKYVRSWEKDKPPAQTAKYEVVVTGKKPEQK
jgi:inhibitor of cysteine peptidase